MKNIQLKREIKSRFDDEIMEDTNQKEDLSNYKEVEVNGIFIKHDFDHIILSPNEIEKYTNGNLTWSTMKQSL